MNKHILFLTIINNYPTQNWKDLVLYMLLMTTFMSPTANQGDALPRVLLASENLNNNSKTNILTPKSGSIIVFSSQAPVAQLDSASVFGTEG